MGLRPNNAVLFNAQANTAGAKNSLVIDAQFIFSGSMQATFTDATSAGTLIFQGSNDPAGSLPVDANGKAIPANWTAIPGATATVSSGGSVVVPLVTSTWNGPFRWLRAVWTRSAGAGTLTVNGMFQGY